MGWMESVLAILIDYYWIELLIMMSMLILMLLM